MKYRKITIPTLVIIFFAIFFLWFYVAPKHNVNPKKQLDTTTYEQNSTDTSFAISVYKLGINAPIIVGVDPTNKEEYDESLSEGVALMQGSSLPNLGGNIIIYGHSSATISSPYEKIFSGLNDLVASDEIKIHYKGTNYYYSVAAKKIVNKDDLSVLDSTKEETLTLVTCWPVGTSKQRLVISALRKK